MLDPEVRYTYLEELRPPVGYVLDRAVATTYSLDLLTLLLAPLAMVFYECQKRDMDLTGRMEVIEALRRVAGRLIIFCQKGRIAVPRADTLLYSYLEPVVVEVQPEGEGVFHPKIWLLRFAAEGQPVVYRFLCLSRNLTFDRSWDTVLCLEGRLQDRKVGYSSNSPLRDFMRALPGLAARELEPWQGEQVELMAEEAGRVTFEVPPGFDPEYMFVPSGIKGYRYPRIFGKGCSRLAVVSPFISPELLMRGLPGCEGENILITREESLDTLSKVQFRKLSGKYRLFTMHGSARIMEENQEKEDGEMPGADSDPFGLHAKLYVAEDGSDVLLATGSANATEAAFKGQNVEFMVRLSGKRSRRCGIDRLFGDDPEQPFPGKLFQPYENQGELPVEDAIRKELASILEEGRQSLLKSELMLRVWPEEGGLYSLSLSGAGLPDSDLSLRGTCYPITLKKERALELKDSGQEGLTFTGLPAACLTCFFAFRLQARHRGKEDALAFVLNLPVEGLPEEREREILHSLIDSEERFINYLRFLLAEEQDIYPPYDVTRVGGKGAGESLSVSDPPLLEELVRAYSRRPEKIARISRLVSELEQTEKGKGLLSKEFRQVWAVFEKARGEVDPS